MPDNMSKSYTYCGSTLKYGREINATFATPRSGLVLLKGGSLKNTHLSAWQRSFFLSIIACNTALNMQTTVLSVWK